MRQVFLSYAHLNMDEAWKLYRDINAWPGIKVWFDQVDLLPGARLGPEITKAIRESRYFIALLSKRGVTGAGYRNSELHQALEIAARFPDDKIYYIPVQIDECEPPIERLRGYVPARLYLDREVALDQLWKSLRVRGRRSALKRSAANGPGKTKQPAEKRRKVKKKSGRRSRGSPVRRRKPTDYHFRVSLIDLDARIEELRHVTTELNQVQAFFHFSLKTVAPSRRALTWDEDDYPQLNIDLLSAQFYGKIAPHSVDHVLAITDRYVMYEDGGYVYSGYFGAHSSRDERVRFTSMCEIKTYASDVGVSYVSALAYFIAAELAAYFLDLDYHKPRNCPLDFAEEHSDVKGGLRRGRFCASCSKSLDRNSKLKQALLRMLRLGR